MKRHRFPLPLLILTILASLPPGCGILEFESPSIVLVRDAFTVSDKGGTVEVEVQSNTDYTVSVDSDGSGWIERVSTRATSSTTCVFKVSPNPEYGARTGTIRFSNTQKDLSKKVTVTQLQKDALVVGDGTVNVDAEGGDIQISVGYNVDFAFETGADWITPAPTRALTQGTLTFIVDGNPAIEERTGAISFFGKDADGNELKADVQVVQSGQVPFITVSATGVSAYSRGETFFLELESNFEPSVSTDAEWIVFQGFEDGDPPLRRLLFKAEGNGGEGDRVGTITFPSPYVQDPPTVTVRQKGTGNGLGFEMLGVLSFVGEDWTFTTGKDQILLSDAGGARSFTLFSPDDNRFFQVSGFVLPEEGGAMDARITQNMNSQTNAVFQTVLCVVDADGPFAKVISDQGFTLVIKTR